ncbi:MAG: type II secretion system protein [Limisphaerales bacterium]
MNWGRYVAGKRRRQSCCGFSLIELLVAVAILILLVTLYWSPNSKNRQQALESSCQKNLQKVYLALDIYANDFGGSFPDAPSAKTAGEALNVLVPRYTSDTQLFVCPGSSQSAAGAGVALSSHTLSYAYYMGRCATNSQQALLSDQQIDTQPKVAGQLVFSVTGKPPGNNHRQFGGNFLFCDGHLASSPPQAAFPLPLGKGEVLLNP